MGETIESGQDAQLENKQEGISEELPELKNSRIELKYPKDKYDYREDKEGRIDGAAKKELLGRLQRLASMVEKGVQVQKGQEIVWDALVVPPMNKMDEQRELERIDGGLVIQGPGQDNIEQNLKDDIKYLSQEELEELRALNATMKTWREFREKLSEKIAAVQIPNFRRIYVTSDVCINKEVASQVFLRQGEDLVRFKWYGIKGADEGVAWICDKVNEKLKSKK